jgi:hypothetical protein
MKIPANTAASAAKTTQTVEKAPEIVANQPEAPQNPVPATDKDTPVLIQYSEPDPANIPAPAAPAPAGPEDSQAKALESVKEVVSAALDVVATATEPAPAANTTAIKVLRSHPKLGAFAGETTTINTALAKELIKGGFAVKAAAHGEEEPSKFTTPTEPQLKAAEGAYDRFKAVAESVDGIGLMPSFAEAPEDIKCAFVAAIDPAYNHKAE